MRGRRNSYVGIWLYVSVFEFLLIRSASIASEAHEEDYNPKPGFKWCGIQSGITCRLRHLLCCHCYLSIVIQPASSIIRIIHTRRLQIDMADQQGLLMEAPDKEALVDRNPHADFTAVKSSRPDYDNLCQGTQTKTPNPRWTYGDGANNKAWQQHSSIDIDPDEPTRPSNLNYKLMISSTVPRPIALLGTIPSLVIHNVAPFSYFQTVCADPPLYSICFVGEQPNDSLRNVLDAKEACISILSDSFVEAANATSINTPPHVSEWPPTGLHPHAGRLVKPQYALESAFSIKLK